MRFPTSTLIQGISPTINTTIDKSNMTFVTIMNKEIIHTAPNGKKYSIQIRKYTPRDCFRLMGVHESDIDKLLSKEKSDQGRQAYQQSAQSHVYPQDHGNMVQRQPNHRNNARWFVVSTRLKRNVGTIIVPVRSHPRLIFTFAK